MLSPSRSSLLRFSSLVRRLGFETCVRIPVCGHVIVFGVRGDTADEIIGDPGFALAGFIARGSSNEFLGFLNEFMWINTENFC